MKGVALLPVRHHSPRASAFVRAELDRLAPDVVMIEAPADAGDLVPVIVDPETRPPVAILGYRTDGPTHSVMWPFATYSPEYVAMAWAHARGARIELIDVPIGTALAITRDDPLDRSSSGGDDEPVDERVATMLGMRSFEEVWEAYVEAPAHEPARFDEAITAYAELVRDRDGRDRARQRDAVMAQRILDEIGRGTAPAKIAVVAGAAHTAALAAGDVDLKLARKLPRPVACARTVIPYSFPRLSEQLGYGAGNRAPRYFQRVHDAGCDVGRATLETLLDVGTQLRLRGFSVSLADTIEAWRLATALAELRGKPAPGLDEAREAAVATYGRGDPAIVIAAMEPSTIGRTVGKVASRVGEGPLQAEFWREVRARRLPDRDSPEDVGLTLNDDVQIATSVFLHRLRLADVPYASFVGAGRQRRDTEVQAGGLDALTRVREHWMAQWTPATDVALVEQVVLGDSLGDVATRVLDRALQDAHATGAAADVLLEAVVAACPVMITRALAVCDGFAAHDDDLPSLARACAALSALRSYGGARRDVGSEAVVARLAATTFERAVLRLPGAAKVDGDALAPVLRALRGLHEVAMAGSPDDRALWLERARATVDAFDVNPAASGLCAGLLHLATALTDDEVGQIVSLRLSAGNDPGGAAAFLGAFFEVNALVLVRSRPVVAALDAFLAGIPPEGFDDLLPALRRAFADLGATERRYLLEHVIGLRGGADREAAAAVIHAADKDKLAALGAELGGVLDDLDDLL